MPCREIWEQPYLHQLFSPPSVLLLKGDDRELVERCRLGDRTAFAALATRYQRPIYNAAYRVLGNVEDAHDITQAVFVRVLERIDEYEPQYKFFSWIYRIAINESIDLLRHNRRQEPIDAHVDQPEPDGAGPESRLYDGQLSDRVQGALMSMKTEDRVVLTLRHFSECSYREMAEILKLEEKTVKSRLFEARQRLAVLLKDVIAN
jgi:RNA polymerase sigma-70 factor, ECF subfamily